jgi:LPXTG-site transpeptidase (sortase) family protein
MILADLERRPPAGTELRRHGSLTIEASLEIMVHSLLHRPLWWLCTMAVAGLVVLGGCAPAEQGSDAQATADWLSTTWPQAAATLTAWPTPAAAATRFPTPTAAPQPLWTAAPIPAPEETPPASGAPTEPAGAPVGSLPPPVRLLIPSLGLDMPVVEVSWSVTNQSGQWRSEWETADHAAGHHRGTANPGEAGNMVISGHHNTKGEVFRLVSEVGEPGNHLRLGDELVVLSEDGREYRYSVVRWDRFQEEGANPDQVREHAQYLAPAPHAILTIITCWPYERNTHRVVVIGELKP